MNEAIPPVINESIPPIEPTNEHHEIMRLNNVIHSLHINIKNLKRNEEIREEHIIELKDKIKKLKDINDSLHITRGRGRPVIRCEGCGRADDFCRCGGGAIEGGDTEESWY
tara:strand:+ start:920 stop:1252 length:333 start_codon:yes stop_codon:yes gene_type:complete